MAVMSKALNKPFYVVAESFKFVRMYPLNQGDLPNDEKVIIAGFFRREGDVGREESAECERERCMYAM